MMRESFRAVLLVGWQPRNLPKEARLPEYLLGGEEVWAFWKEAFDTADKKATYLGSKYRNTYTYLYFFSVLAVFFGVINIGLELDHQWSKLLPVGEMLSLAAIGWLYWSGKKNDWHGKWIHQRFHAEYLRCLPLICIDNPGDPAHRNYADLGAEEREHREERKQLHEKLFLSGPLISKCMDYGIALAKNQYWYFARASQKEKFIEDRVEKLSYLIFSATVIAVLMEFFVHTGWITVTTTLFPAAMASLHGAMEAEESERLERRYKEMAESMGEWLDKYDGRFAEETAVAGMRNLAEMLLSEVGGWHKLMKDRSLHIG